MSPPAWIPLAKGAALAAALLISRPALTLGATAAPPVPPDQRGSWAMERMGSHDAGDIRTRFWNFGMVGDYPQDPANVDLSIFHSVEAPKGSGMNHSDGMTPFLLTHLAAPGTNGFYIMETGHRERQGISPNTNRVMRLEPRPGYFQTDPTINSTYSPAMSDDPRTWPAYWPDRLGDAVDPGWAGHWDGFFGKDVPAGQECFMVLDDQFYDAWPFHPDARDTTRHGLALRFEVRSLQWSRPDARDLIFWRYEITNEGTTPYDSLVFGLYEDVGMGGYGLSCDGIYESDDDNAGWELSAKRNLAYSWDQFGHGIDLSGLCEPTGYVGWTFLQTPGNAGNGIDDDRDGLIDERPDGGPGQLVVGQSAIRAYFIAHCDTANFRACYGNLEDRPAYVASWWWTGDEDMDWDASDDVGADGLPDTFDAGEGDRIPTAGEPDFDRTDPHEVDQLGLTGFKMDRIKPGIGNPDPTTDGVLFYTDGQQWPQRLWEHFTDANPAARFDSPVAYLYNIAYLAASGPFSLGVGETARFDLALVYAPDLAGLRGTVDAARAIHDLDSRQALSGIPVPPMSGPSGLSLLGNFPNPTTSTTIIRFALPAPGRVVLTVLDLQGRVVATSDLGTRAFGEGRTTFDGSGLTPGLYLYRLIFEPQAGPVRESTASGKLIVID